MHERVLLGLLALIYLFLAHLFIPNVGELLLHPREFLIWIAIGAIVLLAVHRVVGTSSLKAPPARVAFLLFLLLSIASILFNPLLNKDLFIIQAVHRLGIYLLWVFLSEFDYSKQLIDRILFILFISASIEAGVGLLQIHGYTRFLPITPILGNQFPWGAFQQKNLFGSFLAVGLVVSLYLSTTLKEYIRRALVPAFYIFPAMIASAISLTGSRTAWVGAIGGVAILLVLRRERFRSALKYTALWAVSVLAGLTFGMLTTGTEQIYRATVEAKESSNVQRILMLKTSLRMFLEKPITGHGFGNFQSLYMYKQAEEIGSEEEKGVSVQFTSHPHNEIALIAVQSGVMGLVGLGIALFAFGRMFVKLGRHESGIYLSALFPIAFHTMVEYPLELSVIHMLTFVLLLAMPSGILAEPKALGIKAKKPVMVVSLIAFVAFSLWMLSALITYYDIVRFTRLEEQGKTKPELLTKTLKNPYLRNWTKQMYMIARAKVAIEEKDIKFLKEFVRWADMEKKRRPIRELFYIQSLALTLLGEHSKNLALMDEAMKVAEEGEKLYPGWEEFKKLKGLIFRSSIKIVVNYKGGDRSEER